MFCVSFISTMFLFQTVFKQSRLTSWFSQCQRRFKALCVVNMWGCSRIFLRNIAFLGSKKQQQRHSHEAVKPKTAPGSPDAPNVADVHPITASRKGLMSKVKENDIKMSFAMKYPYFKIQLIVHRISAMFHLFFAPIDFPHHRLISRKTHPGSWLFTSFYLNVARSIPSFKQIIHFLDFARLHPPSPPLLVK